VQSAWKAVAMTAVVGPRGWASTCTSCGRVADIASRPDGTLDRALCDDCAGQPYGLPTLAVPAHPPAIGAQTVQKLVDGGAFILDAPAHVPAVWGEGSEVLWSAGEPMMICGPQGVGKSTIAQQLILARLGVRDRIVLGFAVAADPGRRVLYVASDRPNQIAQSMRRMVSEEHRERLVDGLRVVRGPLVFDLTQEPEKLLALASDCGAGTVLIDSLKDIAMSLSEDRVGGTVNRALQLLVAEGIEVCSLHHQRKATSENKRPRSLADVYGSTWLTSGHGSVVLLWGEPGDAVIELSHLKQPADEVGPLELVHDHHAGTTSVHERPTVRALVAAATDGGISVADAAVRLHGPSPSRNDIEKARRKLDSLVRQGEAVKVPGDGPKDPVLYRPVSQVWDLTAAKRQAA
jgi:replicative DNA helicase